MESRGRVKRKKYVGQAATESVASEVDVVVIEDRREERNTVSGSDEECDGRRFAELQR